jgi:oligopeptide transport system permease protein
VATCKAGDHMWKYLLLRIVGLCFILFVIISLLYLSTNYAMWRNANSSLPFFKTFAPHLFSRYLSYMRGLFSSFDWGVSKSGEFAWELLVSHMMPTLRIILISFTLSLLLGILLGLLSAFMQNSWIDKMISLFTLVFAAIPNYIWIFAFMMFFGYTLKWLPPLPPSSQEGWVKQLEAMIMPVVALTLAPLAKFTSYIRNELIEAKNGDYLLLLRTKGLTKRQIMTRHLLKDSLVAIMPEISNAFIFILSGSFLLERINNVQGVSLLLYRSLFAPMMDFYILAIDIPVAVLVCTFYTLMGLLIVLMVDLLYPLLDPRIQIGRLH